jgi:hypothetical protein
MKYFPDELPFEKHFLVRGSLWQKVRAWTFNIALGAVLVGLANLTGYLLGIVYVNLVY